MSPEIIRSPGKGDLDTDTPILLSTCDANKDSRYVSESISTSVCVRQDTEKQEAQPTQEEVPPRDVGGWKWGLVVTAILSSIFLYALENTVVADI